MPSFPRRGLAAGASFLVAASLTACGAGGGDSSAPEADDQGVTTLVIGASPTPHAKILEFVDKELAAEAGLDLEIKSFDDYVQPNVQLAEGTLDANYYQHLPYYEAQVKDRGYEFAHYEGVHIEPFALYSKKVSDVAALPEGAQVGINNDPSNQGRALELLAKAGVITLKAGKDATNATIYDVDENTKKLKFVETDPAQLVRSLDDLDVAVINGNYALEADLSPSKDAILVEEADGNPYANFLAVQAADESNPALKKLDELLHSPEVKAYLTKTWADGSVLPAF
ncbi:MetQ/NlpA family ABC transporter substrate-binding protein [Knoellia aerolata]|uniref:Lipoprotein n=1 Tax=Knoellia aerolata DSM 18566 TaxID=1385519 RepID=A0A0A0JTI4_9MICO|nr:MetQ/NlpA family ABC transporter substrate-binding protein [Knoellia aerolata]KGN40740.1 ABC transporter substrate-binding protein [Knoellia aerolata DSM 18566]